MNKKIYIPIITVLFLALIIGFFAGYRIDNFSLTRVPVLHVNVPHAGSTIFLDQREYKTTKNDNQVVTITESKQGTRNVIVSHPERWPWTKNVSLRNGNEYEITAFNTAQTPDFEIISNEDPAYGGFLAEINSSLLPTAENNITSNDSKMSLGISEDTVFVTWNGTAEEAPSVFCDKNDCVRTVQVASFVSPI